ncbi:MULTISPECIES: hypothetical protein [unclassified Microcoleus]|uniref:hypothetical protein n=1 Tax=unclassified Microcoleus TaxID=2642155 RepID=UPI002FCF5CF6
MTNDRKCTRQRQGCGGDAIGDQEAVKLGMDSRQVSLTQADGKRLPSNLASTEHSGTCYQATQAMESDRYSI